MQRLYVIPVKYQCNADCTFCITEEAKLHPSFANIKEWLKPEAVAEFCQKFAALRIKELEITGGGEPFLNPHLQQIISIFKTAWPSVYIKLYTNGFLLKPIADVDELNVSRAHDDTARNNEVFRAKSPVALAETIAYFRPMVAKLRIQTPLLLGCIDTAEKAIEMIERHPLVDQFVFRPLFSKVNRDKNRYIGFSVAHPRAKNDVTGDYCGDRPVFTSNGKLYWNWNYDREATEADIHALNQTLEEFKPIKVVV